jgi:hypothetical protein
MSSCQNRTTKRLAEDEGSPTPPGLGDWSELAPWGAVSLPSSGLCIGASGGSVDAARVAVLAGGTGGSVSGGAVACGAGACVGVAAAAADPWGCDMTEVKEGRELTEEPLGSAANPPLARGGAPLAFRWFPDGAGPSLMVSPKPLTPLGGEVAGVGEVGREPRLKISRIRTSTSVSSKSSKVGVRIPLSEACRRKRSRASAMRRTVSMPSFMPSLKDRGLSLLQTAM